MTLKAKTTLCVVVTMHVLVALFYAASQTILLTSFVRLEAQSAERDVDRVRDLVTQDLAGLSSTAMDWAAWDETYTFVQGNNDAFPAENLDAGVLVNLRLDVMLVVDQAGRVIGTQAADLETGEATAVPASLLAQVSGAQARTVLFGHSDPEGSVAGILLLPEAPMLVASRPILTSDQQGPVAGSLLVGRYLDTAEVDHLADVMHSSLSLERYAAQALPEDLERARAALSSQSPIVVRPLDDDTVAGYTVLHDVYGQPALLLRVDAPRTIYKHGQATTNYFFVSLVVIGLGVAVATYWMQQKWILSPLAYLSTTLKRITASGDLGLAVSLPGRDELAGLATGMNDMLAALARSEQALRAARDELEVRVQERTAELVAANRALAGEVAERRRAEVQVRQQNRELTLLNRVLAASTHEQDSESLLETACEELAQALSVPRATASLLQTGGHLAIVVAECVADGHSATRGRGTIVAGSPVWQHLLGQKAPFLLDGIQGGPQMAKVLARLHREGIGARLFLPLVVDGQVTGSLEIDADQAGDLHEEEVELAWRIAGQVARALAHIRLSANQRRLSTAVEQAGESVIITDLEGQIQYVNPAFEQISGYSRDEVLGQNPRLLQSGKQDAAFYADLWQTLAGGRTWRGRLVNKARDGNLFAEEATITPVRDAGGEMVSYVAVKRDVTREVQLEEQVRQAQKMDAMGRMAAGIAHDFNNLLTVIQVHADLLSSSLEPGGNNLGSIQKICDTTRRAATLTRQLLSFGRRQFVEPQLLNLGQVIADMSGVLQRMVGDQVELRLIPEQEMLWPVHVDPAQVEQVIMNLVINARDAMPLGGKLTISLANIVLDDAFVASRVGTRAGEYVMLAVADTGTGMSDEVKAHLFEPFFTTKERGRGTGLGLATVFGIVKQNEGHIEAYSTPGQGTTFKIYWSRARRSEQLLPAPADAPRLGTVAAGETILVAENDATVRQAVVRLLQAQGYRVLAAEDGLQGLEVGQGVPSIDLLLTNVVMPRMGGRELAERLWHEQPAMRALFISVQADLPADPPDTGARACYLAKPFTAAGLTQMVHSVLNGNGNRKS